MCRRRRRLFRRRRCALGFFRSFFVLLNGCDGYMIVKKKWSVLAMGSVAHFLQQGSLLIALSHLSATRYVHRSPRPPQTCSCRARGPFFLITFSLCRFCSVVLVSQFSLAWGKTLSSATFVSIFFFTLLPCIAFPSLL